MASEHVISVAPSDVKKLRHMLGASEGYKEAEKGFRNYYATSGGEAMAAMERLVAAGLALKGRSSTEMTYYHATRAGAEFIGLTARQIKRAFED